MNKLLSLLAGVIVIALLVLVGRSFWQAYQPQPDNLQGQIEARQYNISSKVPGRIDTVFVRKGDWIEKGQLVYTLLSPELDAKLKQAKAGSEAAGAIAKKAKKGARKQQIAAARDSWLKAKAASELADKTYRRVNNLFESGVIAEQKKDEAYTQLQAAEYTEKAANQMYLMAKEGTRKETKEAAEAQAKMASEVVAEVEVYTGETHVTSWHSGEVSQVLLHSGEISPAGFPVVSIIDMQDVWAVLHIREDQLSDFKIDTEFSAVIPALDNKVYKFKVRYIAVMGDFATWRATDSSKGFDMRTFELEAVPLHPIENLRIGMSILVKE